MNKNSGLKNTGVEQALLGMLLFDNNSYDVIAEILQGEFFADEIHKIIFQNCLYLIKQGKVANPLTLAHFMGIEGDISISEEIRYMTQLVENVISTAHIEQYALLIKEMYMKRKLINLTQQINEDIYTKEVKDVVNKLENELFKLDSVTNRNNMISFFDAAHTVVSKIAKLKEDSTKLVGTTSGLKEMDSLLGGFQKGELVIIAGRPSMGKTALATNIAFNAALDTKNGGPVAFFSLEMPYDQILLRILSGEVGISSFDLRNGRVESTIINEMMVFYHKLSDLRLFIDDTPSMSVGAIRSKARFIKRKHGLSLIVVDYLQLISNKDIGNNTRSYEIGVITQNLKAIAKEFGVPVIALSQLSRSVENRGEDHRPQMPDLRESGNIEQDADVVMFVYREEYYLRRKEPKTDDNNVWLEWKKKLDTCEHVAEILIDKNRNGSIGVVKLHFDSKLTKFSNLVHPVINLME